MKRLMKKLVILVCVLTMVMASAAPASAASRKQISKTKVTIAVGCSTTLKAYGGKAKWSSSNKNVATVNSKGKVTAKKKGQTTITAKIGSKKLNCKVTVKNNVLNHQINWAQVSYCNYEHMYFIRTAPVKMWYDAKGRLRVKIAVKNDTLGSSYTLRKMYMKISDNKGKVIAEANFSWDNGCIINPISVRYGTLVFSGDCVVQKIDLTKLQTFSWQAITYQS